MSLNTADIALSITSVQETVLHVIEQVIELHFAVVCWKFNCIHICKVIQITKLCLFANFCAVNYWNC